MNSLKSELNGIGPSTYSFLLGFWVIVLFSSCAESGSVGGGIIHPGTEIAVDTVEITTMQSETFRLYSGNLEFFSIGKFQDPLFGDIASTGLLKPGLRNTGDTLSFDGATEMTLNLVLHSDPFYGDTLAEEQFNVHEISSLWRANEWRINDDIQMQPTPVASFSVEQQDTIKISMPEEWVQKYAEYFNSTADNRDSVFVREFFGLKVIPQNFGKIVTVDPFESFFLATDLDADTVEADTTRRDSLFIGLREWAFSLQRTGADSQPESSSKVINTLEQVIHFDYNFSLDSLGTRNISKIEILFYRDNLLLNQSIDQAGPNAVRPMADTLYLHYIDEDELPQAITDGFQSPSDPFPLPGAYDPEDEAYHFTITGFRSFFERLNEHSFYITFDGASGLISSTVIYNKQAADKAPIIIITSVERENN